MNTNSKVRPVIGLDIGHSTVKCVARGMLGGEFKSVDFIFPSVAIPSFRITDEVEAAKARRETVEVNGQQWFFGRTAEIQSCGDYATGLTDDWINSGEHSALFMGAILKLKQAGLMDMDEALFVMGLPAKLHSHQKGLLRTVLNHLNPGEYLIAPQPMGPYQAMMLDENGTERTGRSMINESWAVCEVGRYSTDFLLMQEGAWVEKASGSCGGVRVAAEHLKRLLAEKDVDVDPLEAEMALQTKSIKNFGQVLDLSDEVAQSVAISVSDIVEEATRKFASVARKLDGVIIAGGGAPLIAGELSKKWPHSKVIENPRMAVAEGFCRMGSGILLNRARKDAAVLALGRSAERAQSSGG